MLVGDRCGDLVPEHVPEADAFDFVALVTTPRRRPASSKAYRITRSTPSRVKTLVSTPTSWATPRAPAHRSPSIRPPSSRAGRACRRRSGPCRPAGTAPRRAAGPGGRLPTGRAAGASAAAAPERDVIRDARIANGAHEHRVLPAHRLDRVIRHHPAGPVVVVRAPIELRPADRQTENFDDLAGLGDDLRPDTVTGQYRYVVRRHGAGSPTVGLATSASLHPTSRHIGTARQTRALPRYALAGRRHAGGPGRWAGIDGRRSEVRPRGRSAPRSR